MADTPNFWEKRAHSSKSCPQYDKKRGDVVMVRRKGPITSLQILQERDGILPEIWACSACVDALGRLPEREG